MPSDLLVVLSTATLRQPIYLHAFVSRADLAKFLPLTHHKWTFLPVCYWGLEVPFPFAKPLAFQKTYFSLAPARLTLSRFASCALRQGFAARGVIFFFETALKARTVKTVLDPLSTFRRWSGTLTLYDCYSGISCKCVLPFLQRPLCTLPCIPISYCKPSKWASLDRPPA